MPVTSFAASWTARLCARALTSEGMLGLAGCAIACASGSFALYMNTHAAAQAPSAPNYFTVFAQLSRPGRPAPVRSLVVPADDIDPVVTGSIPQRVPRRFDGERPILRNVLLRQIDGDSALVEINDSLAVYKVGDLIPGAGRLMAMTKQGGRLALETSGGLIVESR